MALVTVREKSAKKPEGAPDDWKAPTALVDESWVERWPDDFEIVGDASGAPIPSGDAPAQPPAQQQPTARQPRPEL